MNKKAFINKSSSRKVTVRDIKSFSFGLYPALQACGVTRPTRHCTRGFTLIELLVVVLIIGILAAVALPQYQKAVARARGAEALTMIRSVIPAIEEYILANNAFPPSWDVLSVSGNNFSKLLVNDDTLNAGNYRYILVAGRLDVDPIPDDGKPGPNFIWQSPYATQFTDLPQRTILCYWGTDEEDKESICKTFGSTVLGTRFIEVK